MSLSIDRNGYASRRLDKIAVLGHRGFPQRFFYLSSLCILSLLPSPPPIMPSNSFMFSPELETQSGSDSPSFASQSPLQNRDFLSSDTSFLSQNFSNNMVRQFSTPSFDRDMRATSQEIMPNAHSVCFFGPSRVSISIYHYKHTGRASAFEQQPFYDHSMAYSVNRIQEAITKLNHDNERMASNLQLMR